MSTATITAKEVNELRKATGAGIMDCRKALTEAGGNMEEAVEYLRKKGQKVSELRAGREAKEGVVIAKVNSDHTKGYVMHLSSETDFVAKNEDFIKFAQEVIGIGIDNDISDLDSLKNSPMDGSTVAEKLAEKVGAIGENIQIVNYQRLEGTGIVAYIHAGYKIGVLVELNQAIAGDVEEIGRDVAMQVAAMNPIAVDEAGVPEDIKNKELEIGREQAIAEGKPEKIIENIAQGKLKRYYKDNTLLHQQFVKDGSKTVAAALKDVSGDLTVVSFQRLSLG